MATSVADVETMSHSLGPLPRSALLRKPSRNSTLKPWRFPPCSPKNMGWTFKRNRLAFYPLPIEDDHSSERCEVSRAYTLDLGEYVRPFWGHS